MQRKILIETKKLKKILEKFPQGKVAIVGDIMLDRFIQGTVNRISPEAPVPVVEVRGEKQTLGGAGNVAHNIVSLGGKVFLYGVVGDDREGEEIREKVTQLGIPQEGLITVKGRPTTLKTRIIAHSQQVVRIDREEKEYIKSKVSTQIIEAMEKNKGKTKVLVISDYGKGVITPYLFSRLNKNFFILVDPSLRHPFLYKGVDLVTPNLMEAGAMTGGKLETWKEIKESALKIRKKLSCSFVLVTCGEKGMVLLKEKSFLHLPVRAKEVYDVTGAGDTVVAILSLSLSVGASLEEAVTLSNLGAGIVVGKLGTAVVTREEMENSLKENTHEICYLI